jgi:hypothetical protein
VHAREARKGTAVVLNKLEKWVYGLVRDRPVLRQKIVDVYQGTLGFIPQRRLKGNLPTVVREGFFFGFHDKSPFSSDGRMLLSHRNLLGDRVVSSGDRVEVGCFFGTGWTEFRPLGRTSAWNWQLGSMLQWVGTRCEHVVFNTMESGRPAAVVVDLDGEVVERWPSPVAHVAPDGFHACSYDFSRVERAMPGYGIVLPEIVPRADPVNLFTVFNCRDGRTTFSFSLEDAASRNHHPSMDGAFHYFHHALFSPDSSRLFFLHRWIDKEQRRWTRMFSVTPDGKDLYLFPMDEMVSHVTWTSSSEIFGYLRYPGRGDGYFMVEDRSGQAERFFQDRLDSDGHPTMDRRRGVVVTDTYPDRFRNQYLVLCRLDSSERIDLCRTHLPKRFSRELQVDLHPRLHPTESIVCFDSGHTGTRSLVTLDFGRVAQ